MKIFTCIKMLLLALFFLTADQLSAATFRINNTLNTDKPTKIYATLQDANDDFAVKAGDTLLVEGTIKEYTELKCNKKLVLIGPGYFLTQNSGQASTVSATIQGIDFKAGSEGSIVTGIQFSAGSSFYRPNVYVNGISFIRCYLNNGINIEATKRCKRQYFGFWFKFIQDQLIFKKTEC